MNDDLLRKIAFLSSLALHGALVIALYFFQIDFDYGKPEYIEVGFGSIGEFSSSGAPGTNLEGESQRNDEDHTKQQSKNENLQEVSLPKAHDSGDEETLESTDEVGKQKTSTQPKKQKDKKNTPSGSHSVRGNKYQGAGSFGFDIDWGGKGMRKLVTNPPTLPSYPSGVNKEVDIRLRFSILPDGTIGSVFPLTKADTRLENAAIQALRQWRFEPLSSSQRQVVQTAVIVFPYRLR